MSDEWDIYGNQKDAWGVTRYSLVVHAPEAFVAKVMDFRKAIGLADLTSEPHVSISSALFQPVDLEDVKRRIERVASLTKSFRLKFEARPIGRRENGGGLVVSPTGPLLELRDGMQAAMVDVIRSFHAPNRPYQPHVTLYQGANANEARRARQIIGDFDFGDGFDVSSVELVGRVGAPRGGTREIIASYAFSRD